MPILQGSSGIQEDEAEKELAKNASLMAENIFKEDVEHASSFAFLTGDFNMLTKQSFLESEFKLPRNDRKKNIELQSVNLWTLDEVYRYLDEHPNLNKIDAIGEFVKLMDTYSCMARSNRTKTMYAASKAYAEYILDCHISEFAIN